jgi:hypothetical protein
MGRRPRRGGRAGRGAGRRGDAGERASRGGRSRDRRGGGHAAGLAGGDGARPARRVTWWWTAPAIDLPPDGLRGRATARISRPIRAQGGCLRRARRAGSGPQPRGRSDGAAAPGVPAAEGFPEAHLHGRKDRPWPRSGAWRLAGPALWRWKDRIDARFMEKLRDLPEDAVPRAPANAATGVAREMAGPRPAGVRREAGLGRAVGGDRGLRRGGARRIPSGCRATMRR